MKSVSILGVRVDAIARREALEKVGGFFNDGKQHAIFTPNPEMVVKAQKDLYFKKVLNAGELNLCDGFGLWLAVKYQVSSIKYQVGDGFERIPGTDFMLEVCRVAEKQGRSIYLLGSGRTEVVRKTAESLQKKFPKLKILGCDKGPIIKEMNLESQNTLGEYPILCPSPKRGRGASEVGDVALSSSVADSPISPPILGEGRGAGYFVGSASKHNSLLIEAGENKKIIDEVNTAQPDILFVAFGMGKQEKWIYENLSKMPSVKVAMGVGGAFDYISGTIPRAPRLLRTIGLEWVYRLIKQPQRFGRIFNATVKFIFYVIKG